MVVKICVVMLKRESFNWEVWSVHYTGFILEVATWTRFAEHGVSLAKEAANENYLNL